jgi:hypothetical protein
MSRIGPHGPTAHLPQSEAARADLLLNYPRLTLGPKRIALRPDCGSNRIDLQPDCGFSRIDLQPFMRTLGASDTSEFADPELTSCVTGLIDAPASASSKGVDNVDER